MPVVWTGNFDGTYGLVSMSAIQTTGAFSASSYVTITTASSAATIFPRDYDVYATMPPTPEELERQRARRRERRRAAQQRAEALLISLLSPTQVDQWCEHGWFTITGSLGGRYRIRHGNAGNVRLLDDHDDEVMQLCAHPELDVHDDEGRHLGELPTADVMAGQMLLITTDEMAFHRRANVHRAEAGAEQYLRHLQDAVLAQ